MMNCWIVFNRLLPASLAVTVQLATSSAANRQHVCLHECVPSPAHTSASCLCAVFVLARRMVPTSLMLDRSPSRPGCCNAGSRLTTDTILRVLLQDAVFWDIYSESHSVCLLPELHMPLQAVVFVTSFSPVEHHKFLSG